MKPGPPGYSEKQKATIIDHVVGELACGRSVKRILEEDDGMPASSQFWKWHFESVDVQEKVARARVHGADALMDETVAIADDATHDWRLKPKKEDDDVDEWAFDKENVLRSKLRVDTRQKYAQMIAPRKYGAKLDLTSGGEKLGLSAEIEASRRRAAEANEA